MARLCQGRIVWTPVADRNGHNRYARPVVILTSDDEIARADELFGVVASNTAVMTNPRPACCIELPYHPLGNVATRLRKPTVAVCTWIVNVRKDDIDDVGGIVSPSSFSRFLKRGGASMRQALNQPTSRLASRTMTVRRFLCYAANASFARTYSARSGTATAGSISM
jgi:hypothetical protein